MCWFCKKDKSAIQLMEEELKRQHKLAKDTYNRIEAYAMIRDFNKVIMNAAALELNAKLEKRLKSIEDSIGDLYLVGKSDDKVDNKNS